MRDNADDVKPRYEKYVIPVMGPFGPWGIAFYTSVDTDEVACERCGRMLQWPDAAREHARYHQEAENARALREHEQEQRWHRRLRRWLKGGSDAA